MIRTLSLRHCAALAMLLTALLLAAPHPAWAGLGAGQEDKQVKDLLAQGDLRYSLGEKVEAVEIYKNIVDRYPMSPVKHTARLRLGRHFFNKADYDVAIDYLHKCAEASKTDEEVAESLYLIGAAYFEKKNYEKAFTELRKVTSRFPGTEYCNRAYYRIGEAHFQLKDYTRAIESFRMVGTSIPKDDPHMKKLPPGERLFIKVDDEDLRVLARQKKSIVVEVTSASGDKESVELQPVGLQGRQFVGSIGTRLGKPKAADGMLQVVGTDTLDVNYVDAHTGSPDRNVKRLHSVKMAQDGRVNFVDGIFLNKVQGVALERKANIRVVDYDRDVTDGRDKVEVVVRVKRELPRDDKEVAAAALEGKQAPKKYEVRDEVKLTLNEMEDDEKGFHSGVFVGAVDVKEGTPDKADGALHAQQGEMLEVEYVDPVSIADAKPITVKDEAAVVRGMLNPMKAFDSQIRDKDLRLRTELRVAGALTEMGRIYKDLGLRKKAYEKLDEALLECGKVAREQGAADQKLLEECQYLLWKIYFEKDDPQAAANVCLNLLRRFPNSEYADDALMAMAESAQKMKQYAQAVSLYRKLLTVQNTVFLPDAQFHLAECYEEMGKEHPGNYEQALKEYKTVMEKFPDSRYAPESIVKIANFYYELKDYPRAVEIYEKTLRDYPDAKFVDLILLNYGKCLFKMKDFSGAAAKFDALVSHYPESEHVDKARKYSEYARQRAAGGAGEPADGKEGG
jgi:tetratricopeptide (TPR) repeat protein